MNTPGRTAKEIVNTYIAAKNGHFAFLNTAPNVTSVSSAPFYSCCQQDYSYVICLVSKKRVVIALDH